MTSTETLILVLYFFVLVILAVYGWHRYYLVYLYMKNKDRHPTPMGMEKLPKVTVQLPIYNEMYVADRLIDAVCEMEYPRELLEIQVLDDSTDETTEIAELAVRRHAARGFQIQYLHRVDRRGYKAGGGASSTSTGPPACGAGRRSPRRAAGSTTRSPRTSTSAIARSWPAGNSS